MTEGIIQKVINNWINTRHNQNSKFFYLKNNTQEGLIKLQQELIAEIEGYTKQLAFESKGIDGYAPMASYQKACKDIREKLIGDIE